MTQVSHKHSGWHLALKSAFVLAFLVIFMSSFAQARVAKWIKEQTPIAITELLMTPGDHQAFIDVITAPSTKSIKMSMFHLSDPDVISALVSVAQKAVDVQIILDRGHFSSASTLAIAQQLVAAGAKVKASSPVFNITHTKYMLVNDDDWFVTSINLTTEAATTLDLGVRGNDLDIFKEILSVFMMDFANGDADLQKVATEVTTGPRPMPPTDLSPFTPPLNDSHLVWSPTDSAQKIIDLIHSAQHTLILTVENLKYQTIQDELVAAVARGVQVQVVVPQVDMNPDANFNLDALLAMQNVKVNGKIISVPSRMMPGPASVDTPYVHLKMIAADGENIYIGSENFTFNSLMASRELGIIFANKTIAAKINEIFQKVWKVSVEPKPKPYAKTNEDDVPNCSALF